MAAIVKGEEPPSTGCTADAAPCGLHNAVSPVKMVVIQAHLTGLQGGAAEPYHYLCGSISDSRTPFTNRTVFFWYRALKDSAALDDSAALKDSA